MARFTPFEVGQVKAHLHHNLGPSEISRIVLKQDGKSHFSVQAVCDAINKLQADPKWRGEREEGSGASRKTTAAQDKALEKEVMKSRVKRKVTVTHLLAVFPWARGLSKGLLEDRLHEVGLRWLRRRRKTIVTREYLQERIAYSRTVSRMHQATLDSWAYTDGTTFFLDRTTSENQMTQVAALGGWDLETIR